MATYGDALVAEQSLGESPLRKNVLPIKASDTHMWLHSSALIVVQQVADVVLYRAGKVKEF